MKKSKKIVCTLLVVVMCLLSLPLTALPTFAVSYSVGDIIQFGSYPQTEVKDEALIEILNSMAPDWDNWISYGYYSGSGDDGSMVQGDWMRYTDIVYDGIKYRGVKFTQYRPNCQNPGSLIYNNQGVNGYYINISYWFRFEPIDWRILDPTTGLIMCETIIDSQPYSNTVYSDKNREPGFECFNDPDFTHYANDYETSSIRKWLNENFYQCAFSDAEKTQINFTMLDNRGAYSILGQPGLEMFDSNSTNDQIFLLSFSEVYNSDYGFDPTHCYSESRKTKGSDYSKIQGLEVFVDDDIDDSPYSYYSSWILRSPGSCSDLCGFVDQVGLGGAVGSDYSGNGIRPALCLDSIIEKTSEEFGDVIIITPGNPEDHFEVIDEAKNSSEYILTQGILEKEIDNCKVLKVFDISLVNQNGVHVQPKGTVKVKLPIGSDKDGIYKIYRINDDGTYTDMNAVREGSHMVFETNHFSIYAVIEILENSSISECICPCHNKPVAKLVLFFIGLLYRVFGLEFRCACGASH